MRRFVGLILFTTGAFVLTLVPGGVWATLLTANLRTGIGVPWAVPAALALLFPAWRYAGGAWAPEGNAKKRRLYRRTNALPAASFIWALAANGLAITALTGLWVVLFQLVKAPGNPVPDFSLYPLPIIGLVLGCASIVGAVSEEVGLRGYLQGAFERIVPAPVAIMLMALVASPGHALTQGFVWPTLLFYFLADVSYGVTARLTNSILPGITAHATGLLIFFALIWPGDRARQPVSIGDADIWFWIHTLQAIVFGALAVWAFIRLARMEDAPKCPQICPAEA
jgi:membrane protease YdiL (CAAX protease family)